MPIADERSTVALARGLACQLPTNDPRWPSARVVIKRLCTTVAFCTGCHILVHNLFILACSTSNVPRTHLVAAACMLFAQLPCLPNRPRPLSTCTCLAWSARLSSVTSLSLTCADGGASHSADHLSYRPLWLVQMVRLTPMMNQRTAMISSMIMNTKCIGDSEPVAKQACRATSSE